MTRGFKEQNKIAWNEGKYKKSLNDSELKVFKSLNRIQKDTVVLQYLKDEPLNLLDDNSVNLINEITFKDTGEVVKSKEELAEEKEFKKKELEKERKEAGEARIEKTEMQKQKAKQVNRENLTKFFDKQGIPNPTNTTIDAFSRQRIDANVDKVLNSLGMFTTNREKQAQYNYYVTQQKQNFIQIAQNDKLIKQNDEIIDLLKIIANK